MRRRGRSGLAKALHTGLLLTLWVVVLLGFRVVQGGGELEVAARYAQPDVAQLFFDRGQGFRQEDSRSVAVSPTQRRIVFDLPPGRYHGLRLDPDRGGHANRMVIERLRLLLPGGEVIELPLDGAVSGGLTATPAPDGWALEIGAEASDPQVVLKLPPVSLYASWSSCVLAASLGVFALHLLLIVVRRAQRHSATVMMAGLGATLAGLFAFRALSVEHFFGAYTGCSGCFVQRAVVSDLEVLAVVAGLVGLGAGRGWWAYGFRAAAAVVVLLYVADVLVFDALSNRLFLSDVFGLGAGGDGGSLHSFVAKYLADREGILRLGVAMTALVLSALAVFVSLDHLRLILVAVALLSAGSAAGAPLLLGDLQYVHQWSYQNVLRLNGLKPQHRGYSDGFAARLQAQAAGLAPVCQDYPQQRRNVILVLIESLSSYQSRLLSGLNDYLPHIDAIAAEHMYFTDFRANGFTTDGGLIALFAGDPPVSSPGHGTAGGSIGFKGYFNPPDSLPRAFGDAGYATAFLTAGTLEFARQGEWLRNIGFQDTESGRHPFYDGQQRFGFDSVSDAALYARSLRRIDEFGAKPYFMAVETVTTHPPFENPDTGKHSEEEAFRYADRAFFDFYQALQARGFFENGILIVTGDHRTMTPVQRGEVERFGTSAMHRLPLVVAGLGQGRVDRIHQQTDVFAGLAGMVRGRFCGSVWRGDPFGRVPAGAECSVQLRGDARDLVNARCGDADTMIRLDGDDTGPVDGPSTAAVSRLVDAINLLRLRGLGAAAQGMAGTGG